MSPKPPRQPQGKSKKEPSPYKTSISAKNHDEGRLLYKRVDPIYYRFAIPIAMCQAALAATFTLLLSVGSKKNLDNDYGLQVDGQDVESMHREEGVAPATITEKDTESNAKLQRVSRPTAMVLTATAGFAAFVLYGSIAITNKRIVAMRAFDGLKRLRFYSYDYFGRRKLRVIQDKGFGEVKVSHAKLRDAATLHKNKLKGQKSFVVLHNDEAWYTIDTASCSFLDADGIELVTTDQPAAAARAIQGPRG